LLYVEKQSALYELKCSPENNSCASWNYIWESINHPQERTLDYLAVSKTLKPKDFLKRFPKTTVVLLECISETLTRFR